MCGVYQRFVPEVWRHRRQFCTDCGIWRKCSRPAPCQRRYRGAGGGLRVGGYRLRAGWLLRNRALHDLVREANELAEAAVRPGIPLRELDRIAREHIAAAGYGENFTHRLGHFIGTECHESGDVSATTDLTAEPGMCFSIEPGVYLPGETGVRVEDLVLVTAEGCRVLNHLEKRAEAVGGPD